MSDSTNDLIIFGIVLALRLIVPLAIPRFPLPAMIAAMLIDAADQTIFQNYTQLNLDWYQGYDKALDIYYLAIAYIATMRNWTNLHAFGVGRFLWYYRLIGVVLFESLQLRVLLFVFPNTFEYFFDFIEGIRTRWNPRHLNKLQVMLGAAVIWIFIKLPQEYWIHIAQMDVTDFIKEDIFGMTAETRWGDVVGEHIPAFVGILVVLIGLFFVLRWIFVQKLPTPDWGWTFDADAHRNTDPAYQAQASSLTPSGYQTYHTNEAEKFFNSGLIEKIVLLTLIVGIFGSVLPGIHISTVSLVFGIATIVILNTIITEFFAKRGGTIDNAMMSFFTVVGANYLIVILWRFFLRRDGSSLDPAATLFFLFLISIIITLFDRYRPIYLRRLAAEQALAAQ